MPFDGRDYSTRIDALEKIDRVIEQLPSEERWCKGALYTVDGRRCILGAMQAVNGAMVLKQPILQAIQEVTGRRYTAIETFNDRRTTTYPKVVAVLNRARQDIIYGSAGYTPGTTSRMSWLRRMVSVG
ncbi:MAG TPA: hypothetical protein VHY80_17790 [Stellaceae bacterium]|nr:hypothetical protein [Stellaceae bacterium]